MRITRINTGIEFADENLDRAHPLERPCPFPDDFVVSMSISVDAGDILSARVAVMAARMEGQDVILTLFVSGWLIPTDSTGSFSEDFNDDFNIEGVAVGFTETMDVTFESPFPMEKSVGIVDGRILSATAMFGPAISDAGFRSLLEASITPEFPVGISADSITFDGSGDCGFLIEGEDPEITPLASALSGGYNISMQSEGPTIEISAIPGSGEGRAPNSELPGILRFVNGVSPLPSGDLVLEGEDCMKIEPSPFEEFPGVVVRSHCLPCCSCEDARAVNTGLNRLWAKVKDLHIKASAISKIARIATNRINKTMTGSQWPSIMVGDARFYPSHITVTIYNATAINMWATVWMEHPDITGERFVGAAPLNLENESPSGVTLVPPAEHEPEVIPPVGTVPDPRQTDVVLPSMVSHCRPAGHAFRVGSMGGGPLKPGESNLVIIKRKDWNEKRAALNSRLSSLSNFTDNILSLPVPEFLESDGFWDRQSGRTDNEKIRLSFVDGSNANWLSYKTGFVNFHAAMVSWFEGLSLPGTEEEEWEFPIRELWQDPLEYPPGYVPFSTRVLDIINTVEETDTDEDPEVGEPDGTDDFKTPPTDAESGAVWGRMVSAIRQIETSTLEWKAEFAAWAEARVAALVSKANDSAETPAFFSSTDDLIVSAAGSFGDPAGYSCSGTTMEFSAVPNENLQKADPARLSGIVDFPALARYSPEALDATISVAENFVEPES